MGLSSEDHDKTGRAKPGTPGWTVKRGAPPDSFKIKTERYAGGMRFRVRSPTATVRDNGVKAMFRDYAEADWELKPLLLWLSVVISVYGFYATSELFVKAAKTSMIAAVGQERQAEHDEWRSYLYVSWNGLKQGKLWTLLTDGVTHDRLFMLLPNIALTMMVAPQLILSLGSPGAFYALCATSSVVGSLSSAYAMHSLGEDDKEAAGGSATVNGLLTYFALSKNLGTFSVASSGLSIATWLLPVVNLVYITWIDYDSRRESTDPATKPGGELVAPVAGAAGGALFFVARKLLLRR